MDTVSKIIKVVKPKRKYSTMDLVSLTDHTWYTQLASILTLVSSVCFIHGPGNMFASDRLWERAAYSSDTGRALIMVIKVGHFNDSPMFAMGYATDSLQAFSLSGS